MRDSSSELKQPVAAGLFSTPRDERQARALPVLQQVRRLVAGGKGLLEALREQPVGVEREFARAELYRAVLRISGEIEQLDRWGDTTLRLWFVDRALRNCGALHRGGHHVTASARRSA